jgi:hypothetical protein
LQFFAITAYSVNLKPSGFDLITRFVLISRDGSERNIPFLPR